MRTALIGWVTTVTFGVTAAAGCGTSATGPDYNPVLPTSWAGAVTNAYFPLVPGTVYEYRGQTSEGLETTTIEVLPGVRMVHGVAATVVRDRVYLDGSLIEDTYDWYAQADDGAVWYLGEDSKEILNGQVINTDGSWEWGVDGALPGIIMWGTPATHVGEEYRQEFYEGEAEDWAKVIALNETVTVPNGTFTGCIRTEDWNALESGSREEKVYCPQVGLVLEIGGSGERVELVSRTTP